MRLVTRLVELGLSRLSEFTVSELEELKAMAYVDFAEAFHGLTKAEGETQRDTEGYWKQTLERVKKDPEVFDNENCHAVSHVEKHAGELDNEELSEERREYLVTSFGRAMRLSAQLYLACEGWIRKKSQQ